MQKITINFFVVLVRYTRITFKKKKKVCPFLIVSNITEMSTLKTLVKTKLTLTKLCFLLIH